MAKTDKNSPKKTAQLFDAMTKAFVSAPKKTAKKSTAKKQAAKK